MAVKTISSGVYSPDISEKAIFCDTSINPITIILPNISASSLNNSEDYLFYVIDSGNNASVNNITIIAGGNQEVNSLKSITLNSDGSVATFSVASIYDWVCNISYTQSTKSSLVQVPQTNFLQYPLNQEWIKEFKTTYPDFTKFDIVFKYNNDFYSNPFCVGIIGDSNFVYLFRNIVGNDFGIATIFQKTSDTTLSFIDAVYLTEDFDNYGFDSVNSFNENSLTFGYGEVSGDNTDSEILIWKAILSFNNNKLTLSEDIKIATLKDLFIANTQITEAELRDSCNLEFAEPSYSGLNDYSALMQGGKYEGYTYIKILPNETTLTSIEKCAQNLLGINPFNTSQSIQVNLYDTLFNCPNYNKSSFIIDSVFDSQRFAEYIWKAKYIVLPIGYTIIISDNLRVDNISNNGVTCLFCPQSNDKVLYLNERDERLNYINLEGSIRQSYGVTRNGIITASATGNAVTNAIGRAYNVEKNTSKSYCIPVVNNGSRIDTSSVNINETNNGIMFKFGLEEFNTFYNQFYDVSIFVDTNGDAKIIIPSNHQNYYPILTSNSGFIVNGNNYTTLTITEDIFQNIKTFTK